MTELELGLFGVVLVGAHAIGTASGFGSTLLAVALGAPIVGLGPALTLIIPLSLVPASYVLARHHASLERGLLLRLLSRAGLGFAASYPLAGRFGAAPKGLLGAIVFVLAGHRLYGLARSIEVRRLGPIASFGAMVSAGVIHGLYATGGPLLVYALGAEGVEKARFRSTLSAVWLVLNAIALAGFVAQGRYDAEVRLEVLALVPLTVIGVLIGERLQLGLDDARFQAGVFVVLMFAALTLVFSGG